MKGTKMGTMKEIALDDPEISNYVTDEAKAVLEEEIRLQQLLLIQELLFYQLFL